MTVPRVYSAIAALTGEVAVAGIPKGRFNARGKYVYRGIDDICSRLAPLLAAHKLCVMPRVLERQSFERTIEGEGLRFGVALSVAFDVVSARDGSSHAVHVWGEALDDGDKATAKAMSSAYKQAMLQLFCVPAGGADETDAALRRSKGDGEVSDPDQRWDQWLVDIQDMIGGCESGEALDRVQETYRPQIRAASTRRSDVFRAIGQSMADRRDALAREGAQHKDRATTREVETHG